MAPLKTTPLKRVPPLQPGTKSFETSPVDNTDKTIEALLQRVNELETRLAELEGIISVQDQDVVINASKNLLLHAHQNVELSASANLCMSGAMGEANMAIWKVTGIVQCQSLSTSTVNADSYSGGAGNIW